MRVGQTYVTVALALLALGMLPGVDGMGYPKTVSNTQDAGTYIYITSDDPWPDRPVYQWVDVAGNPANKVPMASTATTRPGFAVPSAQPQALNFTFTFYGMARTSYMVCSGGYLYFGTGSCTSTASNEYPYWGTPNYVVAAHMAPLWIDPSVPDAGVYRTTYGSVGDRVEVVQWNHMRYCTTIGTSAPTGCSAGAGDLTFQAKLFERDGRIEVHYRTMDMTGVPATLTVPCCSFGTYTTQEGIDGQPCCSRTAGISYRFGCTSTATAATCKTGQPATASCSSNCRTFAPPSGWAIRYARNLAPTGSAITATVNEGVTTDIRILGSDPEGRPLQAKLDGASLIVSFPAKGSLSIIDPNPADGGNGWFRYTSFSDFNGADSFRFRVSDGFGTDPTIYTATVIVRPINDMPSGKPDSYWVWDTGLNTVPAKGVVANDVDIEITQNEGPNGIPGPSLPIQSLQVDQSVGATVKPGKAASFAVAANGSFTYTAKPNQWGTDSFQYRVCDDNDVSTKHASLGSPASGPPGPATRACAISRATVSLDIRRMALRAEPDEYTILEDEAYVASQQEGLGANDPGARNATGYVLDLAPTHGAIVLRPDGGFTYTPKPNVCDTPGGTADKAAYHTTGAMPGLGNVAAITLRILCVDDPPTLSLRTKTLDLALNAPAFSEHDFARGLGNTSVLRFTPPPSVMMPFPTGILAGPCIVLSGAANECTTQKLRIEATNDNPSLFTTTGQPKLALYTFHGFTSNPYASSFRPMYGWLNFTLARDTGGVANLLLCVVDDGVEKDTASAPGSEPRSCEPLTIKVPGPPVAVDDTYVAYTGHQLEVPTSLRGLPNGLLANDRNATGALWPAAPLSVTLFAAPAHATTFSLTPQGGFVYTPETGFIGTDSFLYVTHEGPYRSFTPGRVTLDVRQGLPPGADFTWAPAEPVAGQSVRFADHSATPGSAMVAWSWDFGDGRSSAAQDPQHAFLAPGSYQVVLRAVDSKGDVAEARHTVTVAGSNPRTAPGFEAPQRAPPVANAGPDFAVKAGSAVQLVGTATPPDGIVSRSWVQVEGPTVVLDGQGASTRFVAPTGASGPIRLAFAHRVFDGSAESAPSIVHVTVLPANQAPTALAGAALEATSGERVVLDGSFSIDPDGDALSYGWRQVAGPSVDLHDAATAQAWFVAPSGRATLAFVLQVGDGTAASSDRVEVAVHPAQQVAPPPFTVRPGEGLAAAFLGGTEGTRWEFGDGSTATGADPVHTYATPGTFLVTMHDGSQSYSEAIEVVAPALTQPADGSASGTGRAWEPSMPAAAGLALLTALGTMALLFAWRRRRVRR